MRLVPKNKFHILLFVMSRYFINYLKTENIQSTVKLPKILKEKTKCIQ